MENQPTVLLLSGSFVPSSVGRHLRARGVHVETCEASSAGVVLSAFKLDLLVVGLSPTATKADETLRNLRAIYREQDLQIPLVALADWSLKDPPSARAHVEAVVPNDLPEAAIAHRLHILAKRSFEGQPLDKRVGTSPHSKRTPPIRPTLRGRVPRPVKSTPPPSVQQADEIRALCNSFEKGDPQNTLGSWLESAGAQIPDVDSSQPSRPASPTVRPGSVTARLDAPAPPDVDLTQEVPSPVAFDTAFSEEKTAKNRVPAEFAQAPDSEPPPSSSSKKRPSVSTSPSNIRVPLSSPARSLSASRIVLVDDNVTRADAIAQTLRAKRVQVHLTSPSLEHVHPRILRKFSPHAVVVDEDALRGKAADLIAWFREDPFLQHVQLLVVRLSRLFRPRSGASQVDSLLPMLDPLATAETSLLEKLGPTCEVEFGLDEVPPHLLLKLLVPRSVSSQIECSRDGEVLTWTVGWNQAADAELVVRAEVEALEPQ